MGLGATTLMLLTGAFARIGACSDGSIWSKSYSVMRSCATTSSASLYAASCFNSSQRTSQECPKRKPLTFQRVANVLLTCC